MMGGSSIRRWDYVELTPYTISNSGLATQMAGTSRPSTATTHSTRSASGKLSPFRTPTGDGHRRCTPCHDGRFNYLVGRVPRHRWARPHYPAHTRRFVPRERSTGPILARDSRHFHAARSARRSTTLARSLLSHAVPACPKITSLAAYSYDPLLGEPSEQSNMFGLYLMDRFGNKELIYRDVSIGSLWPMPMRARPAPAVLFPHVKLKRGVAEGTFFLQNVYDSWPQLSATDNVRLSSCEFCRCCSRPHRMPTTPRSVGKCLAGQTSFGHRARGIRWIGLLFRTSPCAIRLFRLWMNMAWPSRRWTD